jgi:HSP20 family protein
MIIRRVSGWPSARERNPFEELERIRRQMEWLSEGFTGRFSKEPIAGVFPLVNVTEDKDRFYVRAELPGVKAQELDISITGNSLTVAGKRKLALEVEGAKYHRREREGGRFSRVISLPSQVDNASVEANCAEGILTVTLPKAEAAKPKQITIKAN